MKSIFLLFLTCTLALGGFCQPASSRNILWYDRPAQYFEEALVLGNGRGGATLFGGVGEEKIYLNDLTLWTGEPVNPYMNKDAYQHLPKVRQALAAENYPLADSLNRQLQGKFSESYCPLGTLFLSFDSSQKVTHYRRSLDLGHALAKTEYDLQEVHYSREYFYSYPANVLVIRLSASKPGALSFSIHFESQLPHRNQTRDRELVSTGRAPVHAEPSYRGERSDAVVFDDNRGTRFACRISVNNILGQVLYTDSSIQVRDATQAMIVVSLATSFRGYDKDPATQGWNADSIAGRQAKFARQYGYENLLAQHIHDYQKYFNRVKLQFDGAPAPDLPTDQRLRRYAEGASDPQLESLYFQFGRYLLIASSRTPGVPANLQGVWNPYMRPPWSSNYTMNINLEENYWLAENTNLSEMHQPLMDFISNLAQTGKVTARTFYGAQGWAACHNSDIWAMSNPVGDFGNGDPVWANWNMGGAWLSTHLWEHFAFSGDTSFLRKTAYPLMKGSAQFCLSWMVKDAQGQWITAPSTSPENQYLTPGQYHGATFYGGTADLAMIRENLTQTLEAARLLGIDSNFRTTLVSTLALLHPYHIGKKGNLQEWYFDWEDEDPRHRHQSHLFGLFPGHQITISQNPDLAEACRQTLRIKGDQTTGWSKGWRINLWARLGDGDHAYKMYRELLHFVEPDGVKVNYERGGGTYPNLLDAHPPFQIDGNFGGAAAVAEMLLQSDNHQILLLPALPAQWPSGQVQGLCARGAWEVSMSWKNQHLQKATLKARQTSHTWVVYQGQKKEISLKKGEEKTLYW